MKAYKGLAATSATITHLKRELMHAIWLILLDDEFMEAYEHGIIVKCADGIIRRVFPRFFTYSADYPEKYVQFFTTLLSFLPSPPEFSSRPSVTSPNVSVHDVLFRNAG